MTLIAHAATPDEISKQLAWIEWQYSLAHTAASCVLTFESHPAAMKYVFVARLTYQGSSFPLEALADDPGEAVMKLREMVTEKVGALLAALRAGPV